ncbi:PREDICTED: transmembrane protein 70 homolog, mitochondrial [Vollenhovia emeryi]|uniref:transmembrane protein 70 homolog, mitochondrial n=1 Tax=Vollenhovia emeryi TaxID=411798 RepID=UPI0005F3C1CA|nr:PREDICTED: transmembrane protein 70 homolog, mitochondrial [Vollenhovia emeryi]
MTFMLRACVLTRKGLFFKNFKNLKYCLTCAVHNDRNVEKYTSARNVQFPHNANSNTENCEKAVGRIEIYYGPLTRQVKVLKLFTLLTSSSCLAVQPFLYLKATDTDNIGVLLGMFAFFGFLAITTPLLIHSVTKKYITRLYYDAKEDVYIADTYNLFARTSQLTFTPKDVTVPDVAGIFTNCSIKNMPFLLDKKFFHDNDHYIRVMGYDKPIDFKLNNDLNRKITINAINANCNKKDENKKLS